MRRDKGLVLVLILWIVALLSVIMYTALFASRTDYSLASNYEKEEKIKQIGLSGVEYAIAELLADQNNYQTLTQSWSKNDAYKEVTVGEGAFALIKPNVDGGSTIDYGIQDEAGKINLNVTAADYLKNLEPLTNAMAQSIVDWRDEDSNALPEGAEDSYYAPLGYTAKNKPFETIEELLYVRDIKPSVLYGKDKNRNGIVDTSESTDAVATSDTGIFNYVTCYSWDKNVTIDNKKRLNLNTANDADLRKTLGDTLNPQQINMIMNYRNSNGKFASVGDLLNVPTIQKNQVKQIVDRVTVTDDEVLKGLVNVNTAPKKVLKAFGIPDEKVDELIKKRSSGGQELSTIGWLIDVDEGMFRMAANYVTTRSRHFRVDVVAKLTDEKVYRRYLAIVEIDKEKKTAKILYFHELSHLRVNPW
jgi:type II secretory pathway component PulK